MTRTRWLLVLAFALAIGAGGAAGFALARRLPRPRPGEHFLERELKLTPEQAGKVQDIWKEALETSEAQQREQRQALRQQRDDALRQLMTGAQYLQYDEIMKKYSDGLAAIEAARHKVFEDAVARTRPVLTEPQRTKYDELMQRRSGWRSRHGATRPPEPGAPLGEAPQPQEQPH